MKKAVFWDIPQCGSCKNLCFGETYRLHHQSDKNQQLATEARCEGTICEVGSVSRGYQIDD
jgi:hypothetical protein